MILAVENGHFELAVALLDAGADPNDQRSGFTALHTLTWVRKPNRGDEESGDPAPIGSGNLSSLQLVEKLVEHGADVNARLKRGASGRGVLSRVGATPFLLAAMTADVPFMKTLVKLGADPRLPNAQHCTPLMAAAGVGCLAPGEEAGTEDEAIEAVKLALELGNDVNAVDDNGETAMHGAAYKSFPKIVQLLADKGARIEVWNHKNKYGWTPMSIAEGHRPGNFKPSPETIAALHRVMLAAGISPLSSATPIEAARAMRRMRPGSPRHRSPWLCRSKRTILEKFHDCSCALSWKGEVRRRLRAGQSPTLSARTPDAVYLGSSFCFMDPLMKLVAWMLYRDQRQAVLEYLRRDQELVPEFRDRLVK